MSTKENARKPLVPWCIQGIQKSNIGLNKMGKNKETAQQLLSLNWNTESEMEHWTKYNG